MVTTVAVVEYDPGAVEIETPALKQRVATSAVFAVAEEAQAW